MKTFKAKPKSRITYKGYFRGRKYTIIPELDKIRFDDNGGSIRICSIDDGLKYLTPHMVQTLRPDLYKAWYHPKYPNMCGVLGRSTLEKGDFLMSSPFYPCTGNGFNFDKPIPNTNTGYRLLYGLITPDRAAVCKEVELISRRVYHRRSKKH